jgi:hypothetical protein
VTAYHLGTSSWTSTQRGWWSWAGAADTPREQVLRAAALLGESGAIGGWAAALLHGVPWQDGIQPGGGRLPVLLCVPPSSRCRRGGNVQVFRSDLDPSETVVIAGIRVTSLVRTCVDLARLASDQVEAVVCVDAVLRKDPTVLQGASHWLDTHRRWKGANQAAQALLLARPGVGSPQESRLRILWLAAGLPMPQVNVRLADHEGHLLGMVDLFAPEAGLVGEYDGAHHAGAGQRSVDHARRERLQRAGLLVVQHTSQDLRGRRSLAIARLRALHAQGLARDRSQDGWRQLPPR